MMAMEATLYDYFYCPYCNEITSEGIEPQGERAKCTKCGKYSYDYVGKPIRRYCPRCDKINPVERRKDIDECIKCHLVMGEGNVAGSLTEYTRDLYPEYPFKAHDSNWMICFSREFGQGTGYWCKKFNRPCIGSCEWKRERILKRQANIAEWF